MSFWQCPVCVRESYFCDKTHLKLHLINEHDISGRILSRMTEGLMPAFESCYDSSESKIISESEIKNESEKEQEVHQQCRQNQ